MDNPTPTVTTPESIIPEEIKGWSWGGFLWSWIWAIGNNTWIGLLALIPFLSLIIAIILGVKGREWAWKNKHWNSVDDFKRVQRSWVKWWFIIMIPLIVLYVVGMVATVMLVAINPSAQMQKAKDAQTRYDMQIKERNLEMESIESE